MATTIVNTQDASALWRIEQTNTKTPWNEALLLECFDHKSYHAWCLLKGDQPVAYLLVKILANECHLIQLTVLPTFQKRGYAQQLIRHLLTVSNQYPVDTVILEVAKSNTIAKHIYEKCGFKLIGERKKYYCIDGKYFDADVFSVVI